ncbi:MAG: GGDEF domain-containing protein [Candidatus Omnitrophica bacterium]|nr:GGDEF domain-containing protein [Candidatus Omnitrophota bacterium]
MLYLTALFLLTLILQVYVLRLLRINFNKADTKLKQLTRKHANLFKKNAALKSENAVLGKSTEEIIQIYEVTKNICKSLDEEQVFNSFREDVSRFIKLDDCKFLSAGEDTSRYDKENVLPINIDDSLVGYLAAINLRADEREEFFILGGQFKLGIERAILYKKVQELAITDGLTQLLSRRYFLEKFAEEIERSQKFGLSFAFLMIDLDNFKSFNDRYGHLVGDALLREVANGIKENIRQIDFICRYGGEEIALVLAETNQEHARLAAERIRRSIESKNINIYDEVLKITISIGMSNFPDGKADAKSLIEKADKALYKAKQSGRNKVCF